MTVTFLLWFWAVGFHQDNSPKDVGNTYSLLTSLKVGGEEGLQTKPKQREKIRDPRAPFGQASFLWKLAVAVARGVGREPNEGCSRHHFGRPVENHPLVKPASCCSANGKN